ncbi:MAG TPA: 16S rRNA (cytidine(1402)-2'-O)-methyltransferase [Acidimicrobiales bacterium]|nr:16S rRNA (cytidine(1402)-2'-O)-methyltransferase [Acidimicrobiales bacterium]
MTRIALVGMPIGNLGDLSPRAVAELEAATVIACEDTRSIRKLLSAAGVRLRGRRLVVMAEHNEAAAVSQLVGLAAAGEHVAVVTDAGMPGISDPGEHLVAAAVEAGIEVDVVPGPSASLAGLVVSGLPTQRFVFEGFLPRKGSARTERLRAVVEEPRTVVLYEAPHRLRATLADLAGACDPGRRVALIREITKLHQEIWRGTLGGAVAHAAAVEPRGEYVVVVEGAPPRAAPTETDIENALAACLATGVTKKEAISSVATELGVSKKTVYAAALRQGQPDS